MRLRKSDERRAKLKIQVTGKMTTKNAVVKEPTCLEDGQEGESHEEQTSARDSHHGDLEMDKWR